MTFFAESSLILFFFQKNNHQQKQYHWDRLYGFYWIKLVRTATYPGENNSNNNNNDSVLSSSRIRRRSAMRSDLGEKRKELLGILDSLRNERK